MAEPIPADLGDDDQRLARKLVARNMFLIGCLVGFVFGCSFALSLWADQPALGFISATAILVFVWVLIYLKGRKKSNPR